MWQIVLAGGGGALVAFVAIRAFGEKWLENLFASKLERTKQDSARELERLKSELQVLLGDKSRFREKQFDALVSLWSSLREADLFTRSVFVPLKTYPDFKSFDDEDIHEYLKEKGVSEKDITYLIKRGNREKELQKFVSKREIRDAKSKLFGFRDKLFECEIFISDAMYESLIDYFERLFRAIISREVDIDHGTYEHEQKARDKLDSEDKALFQEIAGHFKGAVARIPDSHN